MGNDGTQAWERHQSLYFFDGNVVLLAPRPDQPGLLFRVHKSVLSSNSRVFSDMFDVCDTSSTSGDEVDRFHDGVPLIHMSDHADALESVLKVLYYQSDLPWVPRSPHYPTLITPTLELARKYAIDRMHAQIVKHIESDWPRSLECWEKFELDSEFMTKCSGEDSVDDHFPEPAAAIRLARRFDIPSILPAAFYHLSRLSILDDWDKTRADPSLRVRNLTKRTARWGLLSAQDFRCLLLGKAELADFLRECITNNKLQHIPVDRRAECKPEQPWMRILDECLQSPDPLAQLKGWIEGELGIRSNAYSLCKDCREKLGKRIRELRTQLWENLGTLFHLKDE